MPALLNGTVRARLLRLNFLLYFLLATGTFFAVLCFRDAREVKLRARRGGELGGGRNRSAIML
jgi:hypothetical protein